MRRFGAEMEGKFLGPMPAAEFLDTFLPCSDPVQISKKGLKPLLSLQLQSSEAEMYPVFVRVRLHHL